MDIHAISTRNRAKAAATAQSGPGALVSETAGIGGAGLFSGWRGPIPHDLPAFYRSAPTQAAACLVLALLAGCVSKAEYEKQVEQIGPNTVVNGPIVTVEIVARDTANGVVCYGSVVYGGRSLSCVKVRP